MGGLNRRVGRAGKKSRARAAKSEVRWLEWRFASAVYEVSVPRLKIAVAHAHQELQASRRVLDKYPNKTTCDSYRRASRTFERVRGYAQRVIEHGFVDLAPEGGVPGVDTRRMFGRALDESLLFFMEEEHHRKTLRLRLVPTVTQRRVIDGKSVEVPGVVLP